MSKDLSVAIGLGTNLDRAEAIIDAAVGRLVGAGLRALTLAPLYRTRPVDCEAGTPDFVNTALTAVWGRTPDALLEACQLTELRLGRPRAHSSRSARPIDIDILLIGRQCIERPHLIVPHPRLRQRLFALVPLADIAPDWPIPPEMTSVWTCRDRLLERTGDRDGAWGERLKATPDPEKRLRHERRNADE